MRRRHRTRTWIGLAAALAVACGGADRGGGERPGSDGSDDASVAGAAEAPPSGARRTPEATLSRLDGSPVTLASLRGSVAVVNFWGTWCLPCRTELPELAALAEAYRARGVQVIGIAVDSGDPDAIRSFAREYGVEYELWTATMDTALSEFGAIGYPFTLLVDREGWIRKEYVGPQTLESLARDLDPLLE